MARSLAETPKKEERASDWERDQEAWNLPRAPGGAFARVTSKGEDDVRESDAPEPGASPSATAPATTD